jgi:hypothetical protein
MLSKKSLTPVVLMQFVDIEKLKKLKLIADSAIF